MAKRSNGEGTIYRRSDGRWCAACYVRAMDGSYKRKYVYAKTQKEVKEKLKELEVYTEPAIDAKMTLESWMYKWLEVYKKETLKRTTYENYMLNIKTHIAKSEIGKTELIKINTDILQKFYVSKLRGVDGQKVLSNRTVEYIHTLIGGALQQAYKNELIKKNYNEFTVLPKKEEKEIVPLSTEEIASILRVAKETSMYALIILEVFTGMRKGEILALQWEQVDLENKSVYVKKNLCRVNIKESTGKKKTELILMPPKTKKSVRKIPINDEVVQVLREHKDEQNKHKEEYKYIYQDNDIVFAKSDGTFQNPRELLRQFHRILEKAGVRKCRFHDLRHTFASLLLQAGETPKIIQELLGHSSIITTMDVYTHVVDNGKVGAIQKLNNLLESEIKQEI